VLRKLWNVMQCAVAWRVDGKRVAVESTSGVQSGGIVNLVDYRLSPKRDVAADKVFPQSTSQVRAPSANASD
jgi:hypothetical protein